MARRTVNPEIVTIFWRDIPAQVNGQLGRDRHQIVLPAKFARAIDRAKRKARISTADQDVAQWARTTVVCAHNTDVAAEAVAEADRLIAAYSKEYLGRLAYAGGFVSSLADRVPDRAALLDLEELTDIRDPQGDAP
jgi:hypothetical protein